MASCGPVNAHQQFKSHALRDASLQRETAAALPTHQNFRSARPGFAKDEFAAFNSLPTMSVDQPGALHLKADHFQPALAEIVGYPGQRNFALARNPKTGEIAAAANQASDWAQEFRGTPAKAQSPGVQNIAGLGSAHAPQFAPRYDVPQFGVPQLSAPQFRAQQFSGAPLSAQPFNAESRPQADAFEAAFSSAEESLRRLDLEEPQTRGDTRGESAEKIASEIMQQVSDHSSPALMAKMEGSQFMKLMGKMRHNEVKLDTAENQLIDENGSAYDATADTDQASSHDWPPQRVQEQPPFAQEQPPLARADTDVRHAVWSAREEAERAFARANAGAGEVDAGHADPDAALRGSTAYENGIMGLDDPETYIEKLRMTVDARAFEMLNMPSPFEEAKNLGQIPLTSNSWEEKYEDW